MVREVLSNFSLDEYRLQGVNIAEVEEGSYLRRKKIEEVHDGDLSLMQLTVGNRATVFNLQKANRYQVSLIHDIHLFSSPIIFANTGFTYCTAERTL